MGTHFFQKAQAIRPTGQNLEARAIGSFGYGARAAGGRAAKDLGAAQAIYKAGALKPTIKDAAADAKGPKV